MDKHGHIYGHKHWEFEARFVNPIRGITLGFEIDWRRKTDHAGLFMMGSFIFFFFAFTIYDDRHWSNEDDDFEGVIRQKEKGNDDVILN